MLHHIESAAIDNQVVSLVGPAGVGKTRLAVEVARSDSASAEFDQVLFVDLVGAGEGSKVAAVVAQALRPGRRPSDEPTDTIKLALNRSRALMVLDNCEHVVEAVAELVHSLSPTCPSVRWLATSRERLQLSGEVVVVVEPLDATAAEQLLRDRAGLTETECDLQSEETRRQICERLDRLPLAIELAAQRLSSLTPDELLAGLNNRFDLLTGGDRRNPPRQQTLRAALEWSLDQLDPDHLLVFTRCSVFAGPFSVADAAAVCGDVLDSSQVRVALANLVDGNLVQRQQTRPPYRLLETMRHYGLAELEAAQQLEKSQLSHAFNFVDKAVVSVEGAFGPRENEVVDAILAQSANHLLALETLIEQEVWDRLAEYGAALASTVFWVRGAWVDPFRRLEQIAEDVPDPVPERWSTLLAIACCIRWNRGRSDEAERAMELATKLEPGSTHAWVQGCYARRINPPLAAQRAERALDVCDTTDSSQLIPALWARAIAAKVNDERECLLQVAQRLSDLSAQTESAAGRCCAEMALAFAAVPGSREAAHHSQRAAAIAATTRASMNLVSALAAQVSHLAHHDLEQARVVLIKLLRRPEVGDDEVLVMIALHAAASYFAEKGDSEFALSILTGIPRPMLNPARSPEVQDVIDRTGDQIGPVCSVDELGQRSRRVLEVVTSHPDTVRELPPDW